MYKAQSTNLITWHLKPFKILVLDLQRLFIDVTNNWLIVHFCNCSIFCYLLLVCHLSRNMCSCTCSFYESFWLLSNNYVSHLDTGQNAEESFQANCMVMKDSRCQGQKWISLFNCDASRNCRVCNVKIILHDIFWLVTVRMTIFKPQRASHLSHLSVSEYWKLKKLPGTKHI